MKIKAISLWQPWAQLIVDRRKLIETRSWAAPWWIIGKDIAIHAAKKVIRDADEDFGYESVLLPRGCVVGIVHLTECFQFTEVNVSKLSAEELKAGDFHPGRFGWRMGLLEKFPVPFPVRGHQGIFDWDRGEGA